jgi:DNA repair exonuclease SbcCD nuclease subunit
MNMPGNTIKIIATADIHLGGPSGGRPGDRFRISPQEAWRMIVRNCIARKVDVLMIAGDLIDIDADFVNVSEELAFGISALGKAGVDIIMVSGNHDHDLLPFFLETHSFDHATPLGSDGNWDAIIMHKQGIRFGIAGRSFPVTGERSDLLLGAEDILSCAHRPTVALLHCDTKQPDSMLGYVDPGRLAELPPDLWILGHMHDPELLNVKPKILYTGSPMSEANIENKQSCFIMMEINEKQVNYVEWIEL